MANSINCPVVNFVWGRAGVRSRARHRFPSPCCPHRSAEARLPRSRQALPQAPCDRDGGSPTLTMICFSLAALASRGSVPGVMPEARAPEEQCDPAM